MMATTQYTELFNGHRSYPVLLTTEKGCQGAVDADNANYVTQVVCTDHKWRPVKDLLDTDITVGKTWTTPDGVELAKLDKKKTRCFAFRFPLDLYKFIFHDDRKRDDEKVWPYTDIEKKLLKKHDLLKNEERLTKEEHLKRDELVPPRYREPKRILINDFYERIDPTRFCRPYFDLEYYVKDRSSDSDNMVRTFLAKFITYLKNLINEELQGKKDYTCRTKSIVLTDSSGVVKGKYKYSYHINVRDLLLTNYTYVEELKYRLLDVLKSDESIANQEPFMYGDKCCMVDSSVYSKGRIFRLFGCEKACEEPDVGRPKNSYQEGEGNFVIPYWSNGQVKTVVYRPTPLPERSILNWTNPPANFDDAQYLCFLDTIVSPHGLLVKANTIVTEVFIPDPTRIKERNGKRSTSVEANEAFRLFQEAYPEWDDIVTEEAPDMSNRCSGKPNRVCPCSGLEHDGTNGYHFGVHYYKRKPRYFIRCQSDRCRNYLNGKYYSYAKCNRKGLTYFDEENEENESDEEEINDEEPIKRKGKVFSGIRANMKDTVMTNYFDGTESELVGYETYMGTRDNFDIRSLETMVKDYKELALVGNADEGILSNMKKLHRIAAELTPWLKRRNLKVLMWDKATSTWEIFPTPKAHKFEIGYLLPEEPKDPNAPKKRGRPPIPGVREIFTINEILEGGYFDRDPYCNHPRVGNMYEKFLALKTFLPEHPCSLPFFKGSPIPLKDRDDINVCEGYKANPIFPTPDNPRPFKDLKGVLNHIHYATCGGNDQHYDNLLRYQGGPLVRTKRPKMDKIIVVCGPEGSGKSAPIIKIMRNVFGYHFGSYDIDNLVCRFNTALEGKVMIVLDEVGGGSNQLPRASVIKKMKELITGDTFNIEGKGQALRHNVPNYCNFIAIGNDFCSGIISPTEQRRAVFIKSKVVGMLKNGNIIYSWVSEFTDATYRDGTPISKEDEALLRSENYGVTAERYFDDPRSPLGDLNSQYIADLYAGYLITYVNERGGEKCKIERQPADDPVRMEAMGNLLGKPEEFANELLSGEYCWKSQYTPKKICKPSDVENDPRHDSYYVSNDEMYGEFQKWYNFNYSGRSSTCMAAPGFKQALKIYISRAEGRIFKAGCDSKGETNCIGKRMTAGYYFKTKKIHYPHRHTNAASLELKGNNRKNENQEDSEDEDSEEEVINIVEEKKMPPTATTSIDTNSTILEKLAQMSEAYTKQQETIEFLLNEIKELRAKK